MGRLRSQAVLQHDRGIGFALASALLFGLGTPCAKVLVGDAPPILLAGLLYAGSGLGLLAARRLWPRSALEAPVSRTDAPWLAGAVVTGGLLGPVLLMSGLRSTPASTASLLLNLEGVFTALLAWFVFRENVDRRVALGFALIVGGGAVLSWQDGPGSGLRLPLGALSIAAACFCWAVDNNLTQRVSGADPVRLASIKGLVAGGGNLSLALATGAVWPSTTVVLSALVVGLCGYGVSLAFFVLALRQLGTARTSAYFSLAPFFGATASIVFLHDAVSTGLLGAGVMMAIGAWLHVTERHEHEHRHERLVHEHRHVHDLHHQHDHEPGIVPDEPHSHVHVHEPISHRHPHYPDIHHRHSHPSR